MHAASYDDETVGDVVSAALEGASEDALVVNPTKETVRALVHELDAMDAPPEVRLLVEDGPLKDLVDDFLIGSAVADLVDEGTLAVRTLSTVPRNFLFVSRQSVTAVVDGGQTMAGLTTEEEPVVEDTYEHYRQQWEAAEVFSLRTPGLSRVLSTLEAEIGEETAADFEAVLASLDSARGDGAGLDEVTISLLVAARNGVLLYDISKWGEDVGLASKATFSRTKTRLEEAGLIDTDKVPIDVGRPRLRLKLGDDRLEGGSVEEMAERAVEMLAAEA